GRFRLAILDLRGDTLALVSPSVRRLKVPAVEADSARAALLARLPQPPRPAAVRAIDEMVIPEELPPADALVVGTDGTVWVGRPLPAGESDWLLFPEGSTTPRARVRLPAKVVPKAVALDHVWAVRLADDELPVVGLWRIIPAGSPQ